MPAVYRSTYYNKVLLELPYDRIMYFSYSQKYTHAWYMSEGKLVALLLKRSLMQIKADHPELVWVRSNTLVKRELLEGLLKVTINHRSIYTIGLKGTALRFQLTRQMIVSMHKAMGVKYLTRPDMLALFRAKQNPTQTPLA